jgi:hypothetical protein
MREDVKQKHFSILSVRPRSVLASRPFFVERILVSHLGSPHGLAAIAMPVDVPY